MQNYRDLIDAPNDELATVDPLVMNLLVAKELPALAHIDIDSYRSQADLWAEQIRRRLLTDEREFHKTPNDWANCIHLFRLGVMCHHLDRSVGIAYKESHRNLKEVFYTDANDLFLTGVISDRRGTCGTMAALHLALGWRLGWPVTLTKVWWHCMLRFDNGQVIWNVETTDTGRGGFSCRDDADIIQKKEIAPEHIRSGSDLVTLTPRQVLGVFLGNLGRHHWDTMNVEAARIRFAQALRLYPQSRVYQHMLHRCDAFMGGGHYGSAGIHIQWRAANVPSPLPECFANNSVTLGAGLTAVPPVDGYMAAVAAILNLPIQPVQGFDAGDKNLYRYVGNDATNETDPSGLQKIEYSPGAFQDLIDAKSKTDGKWDADWYYKTVLCLPTRNWYYLGVSEHPDYTEYQRGCVGITNVRLGLPYGNWSYKGAEKGFTDYGSAHQYAVSLPAQPGKKVRIIAVLFNTFSATSKLTEIKWNAIKGEVPGFTDVPDLPGGRDILNLHQAGKTKDDWFWESITSSYSIATPQVLHRPFDWVMPNLLRSKTSYKYVMFCVVYAVSSSYLPPVVDYGK